MWTKYPWQKNNRLSLLAWQMHSALFPSTFYLGPLHRWSGDTLPEGFCIAVPIGPQERWAYLIEQLCQYTATTPRRYSPWRVLASTTSCLHSTLSCATTSLLMSSSISSTHLLLGLPLALLPPCPPMDTFSLLFPLALFVRDLANLFYWAVSYRPSVSVLGSVRADETVARLARAYVQQAAWTTPP